MSINGLVCPNMTIDIVKLRDVDPSAFSHYLMDNNAELTARINNTARAELLKGEVSGFEPSFANDPEFKAKWFTRWYQALRGRLCRNSSKGSALALLFPIAVYLHSCYGISCSKLILGCEAPTVPPLWMRSWLTQAEMLSAEETAQLYLILENAPQVECDTAYILKSRVHELAAQNGIPFEQFCLYPGILEDDLSCVRDFVDAAFQETGTPYREMRPFLGNHKMLRFLISMCVRCQTSPDFFLLQDYSEFAVSEDGRYYRPSSRQLMSLLLRTDAATRAKAIGYVLAATTKRTVSCISLPDELLHLEGDVSTMNIMETYTAEGNSELTKDQRDQLIIDTLKPKLLGILNASNGPLSSTSLYRVADGHSRLARRALVLLEKEGKIIHIPVERGPSYWQVSPRKSPKK